MSSAVLVLDCGATNVRAGILDASGNILRYESRPNHVLSQAESPDWLVWDIDGIWRDLRACAREAVAGLEGYTVDGIVVTTFSDDGAPLDASHHLLYPVISWQCSRTREIEPRLREAIDPYELFSITGEQVMPQHTLLRLLWLREHAPEAMDGASHYLMTPGIINWRLTGVAANDPTTADSMLLTDLRARDYSDELLKRFGISRSFFPEIVEPGTMIGQLLPSVASEIGLPAGIPVIAAGHDTQYAILGSGAKEGQAVLSSGTWELLFVRTRELSLGREDFQSGVKYEFDPVPGIYDRGIQWVASGALEWLLGMLYGDCPDRKEAREKAVVEGYAIKPGCGLASFLPCLLPGTGIDPGLNAYGTLLGCTMHTTRGEIYKAMLEGLSFMARMGLDRLARSGAIRNELIVVGGGSKNKLWNQIRADVIGRDVIVPVQAETTLAGAAMCCLYGIGVYKSLEVAQKAFSRDSVVYSPGRAAASYEEKFTKYKELAAKLHWYYN